MDNSLNTLVRSLIKQTDWLINDNVLVVIICGSRVNNNHKKNSDLDVLLITKNGSDYKKGFLINGVNIDCIEYDINNIEYVIKHQLKTNNNYLVSVIDNGIILKNTNETIEIINKCFEISSQLIPKRKISLSKLTNLSQLYMSYKKDKSKKNYYLLIEYIRDLYHYINNYSSISTSQVYDIYTNKDTYEKLYNLKLPDNFFIRYYLEFIYGNTKDIEKLLTFIDFKSDDLNIYEEENYDYHYSETKIKEQILYYIKMGKKVTDYILQIHPYSEMLYHIFLSQVYNFYHEVYSDDLIDNVYINALKTDNVNERVISVKKMLNLLNRDYNFDYNNYSLRLEKNS